MKLALGLVLVFVLGSIGYGQSAPQMDVKMLKYLNARAKWVKVDVVAETSEPLFVDSNLIERKEMLVMFRVRMERELSGTSYIMVAASCVTGKYIFSNIFFEPTAGKYIKVDEGDSDVAESERGQVIYTAIRYACNHKKSASVPNTIY